MKGGTVNLAIQWFGEEFREIFLDDASGAPAVKILFELVKKTSSF